MALFEESSLNYRLTSNYYESFHTHTHDNFLVGFLINTYPILQEVQEYLNLVQVQTTR